MCIPKKLQFDLICSKIILWEALWEVFYFFILWFSFSMSSLVVSTEDHLSSNCIPLMPLVVLHSLATSPIVCFLFLFVIISPLAPTFIEGYSPVDLNLLNMCRCCHRNIKPLGRGLTAFYLTMLVCNILFHLLKEDFLSLFVITQLWKHLQYQDCTDNLKLEFERCVNQTHLSHVEWFYVDLKPDLRATWGLETRNNVKWYTRTRMQVI